MTKLRCIWNYTNNEAMKMPNNSGIYKAMYHENSYLFLFGNRKS